MSAKHEAMQVVVLLYSIITVMNFLRPGCDIKACEGTAIKNKWRWQWINEKDAFGRSYSSWCKKIDVAGSCYCYICNRTIVYKNNGKKALKKHSGDFDHKKNVRALQFTQTLPGATQTIAAESVLDR